MKIQRREILLGTLAGGLSAVTGAGTASLEAAEDPGGGPPRQPETIDLWPGEAPGSISLTRTENVVERSADAQVMDRAVTGISRPRLLVSRPAQPNGASIMLIPGGGYERLTVDKEGLDPARWFLQRGYTVFVLLYRLPGEGWEAGPDVALSDAQRALRMIRNHANEYGIDPERVAAIGFSAGGHLCADLATRFASGTYEPVDEADTLSARPMLAAAIYPVISMTPPVTHAGSRQLLLGEDAGLALERVHSPQHNVPADAPPCFLVHAEDDDAVPVENTLEFRTALRARGIPVETHLFERGGHGFGMRGAIGKPIGVWPDLFLRWSETRGLI